jgi:hypothetical protein
VYADLNYLRLHPQRVYTAAISTTIAKIKLLEALEKGAEVVTVTAPEKMGAYAKTMRAAREALPPNQAARVHNYVPLVGGVIGSTGCFYSHPF